MKFFEFLDKQGAELTPEQVVCRIVMMVSRTLCGVILAVIFTLLYAFFDPTIDNKEIFAILGPAFSTIIGGFIGLLAGINLNELIKKVKGLEDESQ
jgi:hypothetical protein